MSGGNTYELQSLRGVSPVDDGEISVHPHPHPLGGGGVNSGSHNHNNGKVGSPDQTRLGSSLRSRLVENSWALELLAWCFAAVTFAILYAVLRVFNGKPLSHWNSSISVNTLVTLLTTIASTALIFPVASCIAQLRWLWLRKKEQSVAGLQSFGNGPVDIFVMIFKHPRMLLAYLGTINVILILLFGPITQETVALLLQQQRLGTGSIGACTTYQVTNPPRRNAVVPSGQRTRNGVGVVQYWTVDRRMSSAIDLAITGTPADPSDVQAHCDKANCTFGAYSTLGVCSRVDIVPHDSIVQTCPLDEYGEPMGCNYIVQELQTHPPWRIGNLTTGSNGPSSAASQPYTLWIGSSDIVTVPLTPEDPYNYMFPSPETLTEFYIVYVADTRGYMQGHSTPEFFSSIAALKVGLDLCVYQYNTSVINGGTKTVQMSRTTDLKWAKDSVNASSATIGGKDYTMGKDTIRHFSNYFDLEVFYGSSSNGINIVTGGGWGTPATDTPSVFAGLLVNRS
ncbi:MAG: hypothetical protein Q9199_007966, partial [Rusavskia elegans]